MLQSKTIRVITWICAVVVLSYQLGCNSLPNQTPNHRINSAQLIYKKLIDEFKFNSSIQTTPRFHHFIVKNEAASNKDLAGKPLHIYLEGDGFTWQQGTRVSPDPTPKNPVMLKLMAQDPNPAIYLGRPCYFHTQDPACNPFYWTTARYHHSVIESLQAALKLELEKFDSPPSKVNVFGFSGGGALAHMLTANLEGLSASVNSVVTLGANLDTQTWVEELGAETLLKLSENPLNTAPQSNIDYLHIEGKRDVIVSNTSTKRFKEKFSTDQYTNIKWCQLPVNHNCCWQDYWPTIVEEIAGLTLIDAEKEKNEENGADLSQTCEKLKQIESQPLQESNTAQ